jgi:hypothetical protein
MQLRDKFSVKIKNKKSAFFHSLRISKKKEFRKLGITMYIKAWKYLLKDAYSFYLKCLVKDAKNLSKLYFFSCRKLVKLKKLFLTLRSVSATLVLGKLFFRQGKVHFRS